MNVIFTSESTGKAKNSARKILSRYAELIGTDTWETHITEEGLQTVKALLNRASSPKFSVACHRITHDGQRILMWVVGNKRVFDRQGRCATGWTAKKILPREDLHLPYPVRLMLRLVSLAGLLHDLGKSTTGFQKVIRDEIKAGIFEEYRHEAVSVMMLSWLSTAQSDMDWAELLLASAKNGTLDKNINKALADELDKHHDDLKSSIEKEPEFKGCRAQDCQNKPLLFGLNWLILSHHRLPDGIVIQDSATFTAKQHRRKKKDENELIPVNKLVAHGLPWKEDSWVKRLLGEMEALLALIKEQDGEAYKSELPHIYDHLRLFARPGFQLADHWMSSLAKPTAAVNEETKNYAYANSVRGEKDKPLGQQLHTHSIGVSRYANTVVQELLTLREELPAIGKNEIPAQIRKKSPDKYAWQDEAAKLIKGDRTGIQEHAFFGVILSGTGSGKTIGALKMCAAFSQDMRVMYASPLRSLTLQSGDVFGKLGFATDDLTTIIGDALIKKIFYINSTEANQSPLEGDTALEACEESDSQALVMEGGYSHAELKGRIHSLRCIEESAMTMIATPVVAATLDTIMKLADARRGGYLSHFLRVASSDLVIDEVDMYSPLDQLAIGRLIESCGFWRNRVFLSSATLSPVIAKSFFNSYEKGVKSRNALDGRNTPVSAGWFSDSVQPAICKKVDAELFHNSHQKYVQDIAASLRTAPVKRSIRKYYERNTAKIQEPIDPERIMEYARDLHNLTAVNLSGDRQLSFGCIQVVNVKHCQKIAISLCDQYEEMRKNCPEYDFRVICFHGRLSLASRTYIETRLNKMLYRSGEDGDLAPLNLPETKKFLEQSPARHLMIILVSTMETTGRDHDFDWGMIESRSERDIIQFAGRIRRHRPALHAEAAQNLVVFNEPLKWDGTPWEPGIHKNKSHPFSFFGVGDALGRSFISIELKSATKDEKRGYLPSYQTMLTQTYGYDASVVHIPITPERVLTDWEMKKGEFTTINGSQFAHTVRACEVGRLHHILLNKRKNKAETLLEWADDSNCAGRLLATHAAKYRFRHSYPMEYYWRKEDGDHHVIWFHDNSHGKPNQQNFSIIKTRFNELALLFSFSEMDEIHDLMKVTGMVGDWGWRRLSGLNSREIIQSPEKYTYHAQMGLLKD